MPTGPARLARLARTVRLTAAFVTALLGAGIYGAVSVAKAPTAPTAPTAPLPAALPAGGTTTTSSIPAGAELVTGRVTMVQAGGATGPDLSLPMEINVPDRGRGSATFYNVTSGGQPATVVWQGEEPLDLTGQGAIVPGRINVTVDPDGSTWQLDGAERELVPGLYTSRAPVAVGRAGLAQPEDSATFEAGSHSVVVTTGSATVQRAPMALHLVGPGSLDLSGSLTVAGAAGRPVSASALHLASGPYEVDLTPTPTGLTIRAVVGDSAAVTPSHG